MRDSKHTINCLAIPNKVTAKLGNSKVLISLSKQGSYSMPPNMNTHEKVKNVKGSEQSRMQCKCGTWIQYWRNYTGSKRKRCAVLGCNGEAKVGAHVISVDGRTGNHRYIAPMCYSCNHHTNTDEMFLEAGIELIWANKKGTCDYDYY